MALPTSFQFCFCWSCPPELNYHPRGLRESRSLSGGSQSCETLIQHVSLTTYNFSYFPSCSQLLLVSLHSISLQFSKMLMHELSLLSKALKLLSAKNLTSVQRMTLRVRTCPVWSQCTQCIMVELRTAFGCLSRAVKTLFWGVPPKVVGFVYA